MAPRRSRSPGRTLFIGTACAGIFVTFVLTIIAYEAGLPDQGHGRSVTTIDFLFAHGTAATPALGATPLALAVLSLVAYRRIPDWLGVLAAGFLTAIALLEGFLCVDAAFVAKAQFSGSREGLTQTLSSGMGLVAFIILVGFVGWYIISRVSATDPAVAR